MHKIMVLNAKGGCGKTTIATTLACYFVSNGYSTALMDFDPQQSSNRWLKVRSPEQPRIKLLMAHVIRPVSPAPGSYTVVMKRKL